jgi:hypothetical protein
MTTGDWLFATWDLLWRQRRVRWLLFAFLAAALPILLHGCHGDEDNELFAPLLRHLHHHRSGHEVGRLTQLRVQAQ